MKSSEYGTCPACGAAVISRTRGGVNAKDSCENGHCYPAKNTIAAKLKDESETVTAAGNSEGAGKGQATRKTSAATDLSAVAHGLSERAHESGEDEDHGEAKEAHEKASAAHKTAMLAQAKNGDDSAAETHAQMMVAHDACADAHDCCDEEDVKACLKELVELQPTLVKAKVREEKETVHATQADIVHCRASGSKLPASAPWEQGKEVEFMYMPAGVHTINAGFRSGGINLTIETDPQRDASVCQASLDSLVKETPKQKAFGCFEHEEKQASVWANKFLPKDDGIYLAAEPSDAGAKAVNGKNHRSWSPSFTTNAEYSKCECRKCDKGIKACECSSPSYFFPDGVRGSEAKPAQITGVDFCVGTLTNKPAFRAIAPVKAKEVVQAGGPGSGPQAGKGNTPPTNESMHASILHDEAEEMAPQFEKKGDQHANSMEKTSYGVKQNHFAASANNYRKAENLHKEAATAATAAGDHKSAMEHNMAADFLKEKRNDLEDSYAKSVRSTETTDHSKPETVRAFIKEESLDDIFARMKPVEGVDQILARITPPERSLAGVVKDLDKVDEILSRIK